MDINFRNISAFSQVTPEGLNSVTDGLTASLDAKGIIAVDNAIQSFGEPVPFDQTAPAGSTGNVTEPGSVALPADYLQQLPDADSSTQAPILTNLLDPKFKLNDSVSTFFNHVFGKDGAAQDLASQLGIDPNADKAPEAFTGPNTYSDMSGENPLESTIPAVLLSGGPASNPTESSTPNVPKMTTEGERIQETAPLRTSGDAGTGPGTRIIPIVQPIVHASGDNPASAQFQMDLLRNNFTKLQDMGTTLNQMVQMQQDLTDRRS